MRNVNLLKYPYDRFFGLGMRKEAKISDLHFAHEIPCLIIVHAISHFAALTICSFVLPKPYAGLRFKKPKQFASFQFLRARHQKIHRLSDLYFIF